MYTEAQLCQNAYFSPLIALAVTTAKPLIEIDIGASSADHGEWLCMYPCLVVEVGFILTSEAAGGSATAPTVVYTKRPTPLSGTAETVVHTLTVADGDGVGSTRHKANTPTRFNIGDSMEVAHTVGVTGATGIGFPYWWCQSCPEQFANMTGVLESST